MSTKTALIIGPPRSGTTLLAFLLGGAPGVLSISEPQLGRAVLPAWRFRRIMLRFQRQARLRRVAPPISGDDVLGWQRRLAEVNGFHALVIKETFRTDVSLPPWNNADWLNRLVADRGGMPTVLLIRHPMDVAASTVRLARWATGWRGRLLRLPRPYIPWFADATAVVRWAARNWVRFVDWAGGTGLPLFRYEDLVTDVEATLRRICASLQIAFDPGMLDHRRPRAFGGLGDPGVMLRPPRPVDARAIGRGSALIAEQQELVRNLCGAKLEPHYAPIQMG